jgi:hypothetical protein
MCGAEAAALGVGLDVPERMLSKVQKLLVLATNQREGEEPSHEARTAAMMAAQLIVKHGLIRNAVRPREELLAVAEDLAQGLLDAVWNQRRTDNLIRVKDIIDAALRGGVIHSDERRVMQNMVAIKVRTLRYKGLVVGVRGPNGGYKLAPGVRRAKKP